MNIVGKIALWIMGVILWMNVMMLVYHAWKYFEQKNRYSRL